MVVGGWKGLLISHSQAQQLKALEMPLVQLNRAQSVVLFVMKLDTWKAQE